MSTSPAHSFLGEGLCHEVDALLLMMSRRQAGVSLTLALNIAFMSRCLKPDGIGKFLKFGNSLYRERVAATLLWIKHAHFRLFDMARWYEPSSVMRWTLKPFSSQFV